MAPKSLISNEKPEGLVVPLSKTHIVHRRKPFTKRQAQSANEINAWSNAEVDAGMYFPDEKETIRKAVNEGLKAEKLG